MKFLVVMFTLIGFSQMAVAGVSKKSPIAKTSKTYYSEKESKTIYRTDITVFDDRTIEVDLDKYTTDFPSTTLEEGPGRFFHRPIVTRRNVSVMNSILTVDELNDIVDLLVDLSGAPVKEVKSQFVCAMVPPKHLTNSPLSIVGDYSWRDNRFYKDITMVFSDSGCWVTDKTILENPSDQKLAYKLIGKITSVVDSMMKVYVEKD